MTKQLQISPDICLPLDSVIQTFAILAKRRVGKTYTDAGRSLAADVDAPLSTLDMQERITALLGNVHRGIVDPLIVVYPDAVEIPTSRRRVSLTRLEDYARSASLTIRNRATSWRRIYYSRRG